MGKPIISAELARQELEKRWPGVSAFAGLAEGEESRAFRFRCHGRDFVLRVNRGSEGFTKDALAQRLFGSARLPIPEIMLIEQMTDGNVLCISQLAGGVTLQDMAEAELAAVTRPVADLLDAMAGVDVSGITGYGRFDGKGRGEAASWRDFVAGIADPAAYDWTLPGLEDAGEWVAQVSNMAAHLPEPRQLVHGDFGSNNILAEGPRISGVIDWSEAMVGDGLYDVANILFWRSWLDCMERQARFFETQQPERLTDGQRLRCYQLRIGLDLMQQSALGGDVDMVAWANRRCGEIADRREPSQVPVKPPVRYMTDT